MLRPLAILALTALLAVALGCAPRAMRGGDGTDNPSMDDPAMSTALDRTDLDYLVDQNLAGLFESKFWNNEILPSPKQPVMAIWPRSLRMRSTIIRFSALSFRLDWSSMASLRSSRASSPRGRVPLMGLVWMRPCLSVKNISGDALMI